MLLLSNLTHGIQVHSMNWVNKKDMIEVHAGNDHTVYHACSIYLYTMVMVANSLLENVDLA